MATARATTDHDEIRKWAEARGGRPSRVTATGKGNDPGILRIDFPGYSGEDTLEEIEWDEFFEWLDRDKLAILLSTGRNNRFNKLVSRTTVSGTSSKSSKKRTSKKASSKKASSARATRSSSKKASASRKASSKKSSGRASSAKKASAKRAPSKKSASKKSASRRGSSTAKREPASKRGTSSKKRSPAKQSTAARVAKAVRSALGMKPKKRSR